MKFRSLYALLGASLCLSPAARADSPPNIVFVLIDDLGWNGISSYGNPAIETPHIDRLAREGMRFTDAYAMPQCSPSRFTLLTGQYSARTNMNAVVFELHVMPNARMIQPESTRTLPPEAMTLGKALRAAGYRTGMAGKWHVDLRERENKAALGLSAYLDQYGFDSPDTESRSDDDPKNVMRYTQAALSFLADNRDTPSFFYLAHQTVHTALDAPADLIAKHVARGFRKSPTTQGVPEDRPTADFLAMIDYLDQSIGVLLDGIEKLDLPRETMVIFMSDNGGLSRVWDNAPLRRGKGSEYEGGVRVPLLVRWPGTVPAGAVVSEPVHIVDLFPTFLGVAGGTAAPGYHLDGEDLGPLLRQTGGLAREAIYMNLPLYIPHYNKTPSAFVRMGDYKLIKFYGDYLEEADYNRIVPQPKIELFNLRRDLSEQRDLAAQEPERVRAMTAMLEAWLIETGARQPVLNPNFDAANWKRKTSSKVNSDGQVE